MIITTVRGRKRNWFLGGKDGYYGQPTAVRAKCIICVAGVVRPN
jgi:hypothetical protein